MTKRDFDVFVKYIVQELNKLENDIYGQYVSGDMVYLTRRVQQMVTEIEQIKKSYDIKDGPYSTTKIGFTAK